MTWMNALSRFLVCPLVVALADNVFAGVAYAGVWPWTAVGFVLAIAGIVMDITLLDRLGHVGAFLADTAAATLIVWGMQFILAGAVVTWAGALGAGVLLGLSEVFMHAWIQATRRRA